MILDGQERAEKAMINSQPPTPNIQLESIAGILGVWELEIGTWELTRRGFISLLSLR
jgi:hypothetical protein